jgi:hypothetical protein
MDDLYCWNAKTLVKNKKNDISSNTHETSKELMMESESYAITSSLTATINMLKQWYQATLFLDSICLELIVA